MATPVRDRLLAELPLALRARDRARVAVLRTTLAALANAEAVDGTGHGPGHGLHSTEAPRRHLDEDDMRALVADERDELLAAAGELAALGQDAAATELALQAAILTTILDDSDERSGVHKAST